MIRKKFFLLAAAGAVLFCVTLATAIIKSSANDKKSSGNAMKSSPKPKPDLPKLISLRLTRNGFEPAQLRVPAGKYSFAVSNRTELKSVQLSLDRQAGPRLEQIKMDLQKLKWHGQAILTPGSYKFSAAEDPRWVCEITVTTP